MYHRFYPDIKNERINGYQRKFYTNSKSFAVTYTCICCLSLLGNRTKAPCKDTNIYIYNLYYSLLGGFLSWGLYLGDFCSIPIAEYNNKVE